MTSTLDRRGLLGSLAAAGALAALPARAARFDAGVGAGGHRSIAAALAAAPADAGRPWRIRIAAGTWHEKLLIDKPWIHLIGAGAGRTIIRSDQAAGMTASDGKPWGTSRSASVAIAAPNCGLHDLSVHNSFDYPAARRLRSDGRPPLEGLQALALSIAGAADRTRLSRVALCSWQDTLFVDAGRSAFDDCRIEGAVDFIFGGGTAWFERCRIVSRHRADVPAGGRQGYLTAPSTPPERAFGLVFSRCRLEREAGVPDGSVALGRPWRGPAANSAAAFLDCWMDAHIGTVGWDRMAYGRAPDGSYLFSDPATKRMFEWRSSGPGAIVTPDRRQLSAADARRFTRRIVLGDAA